MERKNIDIGVEDIQNYIKFVDTQIDRATRLVRKHLKPARTRWIEILSYRYIKEDDDLFLFYNYSQLDKKSRFKTITCNLYPKRIFPIYPTQAGEEVDAKTKFECNLLTWATARHDLEELKKEGVGACNHWKLDLMSPESYFLKKWREFCKLVRWRKVPKELRLKLEDRDFKKRAKICKEILEKYSKTQDIFKNNPLSFSLYKDKKLVYF